MFQGFVVAADVVIASLLTCRATVAVVMVWLIRSGVLLLQTSTGSHNSMWRSNYTQCIISHLDRATQLSFLAIELYFTRRVWCERTTIDTRS